MRKRLVMAVAAAVLALVPGHVHADEWRAPEQVVASEFVNDASFTYARDGRPLVGWHHLLNFSAHNPLSVASAAVGWRGSSGWQSLRIDNGFTPALVDADTDGRLLAVGTGWEWNGYDVTEPARIDAWSGSYPAGGELRLDSAPQTIWRGGIGAQAADQNDRGDVAIAWFGRTFATPPGHTNAYVSIRRAGGGRFGPRRRLGLARPRGFSRIATDVNSRGDTVVAWRGDAYVYVRVARRGRPFAPARVVGRVSGDGTVGGVALGQGGDVSVLWSRTTGKQPLFVHAYSPDGRRFGRAQPLDLCPARGCGSPRTATGRDGELFVAWSTYDGADPVVRAAAVRSGSVDKREVARPGGLGLAGLSIHADRSGRAALAWAAPYGMPTGFSVALAQPGEAFGTPEFVPTSEFLYWAIVRLEPASGRPGVLFQPTTYAEQDGLFLTERR